MAFRILLTGGGTGGHTYPLAAVADELQKQSRESNLDVDLRFMGEGSLIQEVASEIGIKFEAILSSKWRRYASFQNILDVLKFPFGFFQALFYVWHYMPDVIFSKGGYGAFLPTLAGKIMMIPIMVHESDAIPGKVNVFLSKLAKQVFISFESSKIYFKADKTVLVGHPIRAEILNGPDRSTALAAFSLNPARPTLLITGANQGAKVINDVLLLSLTKLVSKFQVIHQAGPKNYAEVNGQILNIIKEGEGTYGEAIKNNYRLYPSFNLTQMALAYAAADVIVSRAAAGYVFEIAAIGKPAVLIPLKGAANNHQLANARELAKFGATIIEEDNLTPNIFINEIEESYAKRTQISQTIKQFARPDAAAVIAKSILSLAA